MSVQYDNAPSGPSQRQLRVGEQLRHTIADVLRKGKFDDLSLIDASHNVTVTEVQVSPDMKYATAYVMTLGGADMEEILPALNESAFVFQKEIGKQIKMKFTPRIKFLADGSFDQAQKINGLLRNLD